MANGVPLNGLWGISENLVAGHWIFKFIVITCYK